MRLSELVNKKIQGKLRNINVTGVCFDSAEVEPGQLFFALSGSKTDGHKYIFEANALGAVAAMVEQRVECDIPQIVVENTRSALAYASKKFYGAAADKMKIVAITGTNGKTTTTYMLCSILTANGCNVGRIGTNGVYYNHTHHPLSLTTPDPQCLHDVLDKMYRAGVTHVVMEASAHALALNKLDHIRFAAVGFTNLTQDHLDYFGNMQAYQAAKLKLFTPEFTGLAAVNVDDACGRTISKTAGLKTLSCAVNSPADVTAKNIRLSPSGATFTLTADNTTQDVRLHLPGRYNVENALLSAALATLLGVPLPVIAKGLDSLTHVEGRADKLEHNGAAIVIDFAHTEDGLSKLITATREYTAGRLITLFGCGGDRDKTKRPKMGRTAASLSDLTVVTSDNPRYEDPLSIIADVEAGIKEVKNAHYILESDRKKAIAAAVGDLREGDTLIIAGKGAERYYDANGVKTEYNDYDFVLTLTGDTK